jgi:imidazolonepropionase-like amidohydrolase
MLMYNRAKRSGDLPPAIRQFDQQHPSISVMGTSLHIPPPFKRVDQARDGRLSKRLPMARLVVTNANLIDAVTPGVRAGCSVTVEDERIVEVLDGRRSPTTHGAEVIDLRGAYLLPGLWDAHVHLEWPRIAQAGVPELTAQYLANAQRALLEAGVTGMRMAGAPHFIDVALKRAFDSGQHVGPRLYTCGWFLTTTAGHALGTGFALPCDGPDGFVRTIREHIQAGVDHIKLNLTGGIMGPAWDRHWHSFFTESELQAAFAICHQRGLKVMAHAASAGAVKAALRLGAHSVEHGYIMDDECIALLLEHNTWYVPTLAISHLTASQATDPFEAAWVAERGLSPALCCRAEAASDVHAAWFRKALDAGVRMALGSDIRPLKEAALLEMGLWVRDGATPWQTLVAATRHGAEVCGVGAELGTVEVGKLADLIVVGANPLEDITNVRRLQLVLKDGRIVSDRRDRSGAG